MLAKKSAFDILMNRTNRQKNESPQANKNNATTAEKKNEIATDTDEIIVLVNETIILDQNDDDVAVKENDTIKKNEKIAPVYHPIFFQHTHQYSNDDEQFLESLKSPKNVKFKEEPVEHDIEVKVNSIVNSSVNGFKFRFDKNLDSVCCCSKNDEFEVTFSLNNSMENNDTTVTESMNTPSKKSKCDETSASTAVSSRRPSVKRRKDDVNADDTEVKSLDDSKVDNCDSTKSDDAQEPQLWTEKYQFKNEDDIVTNNSQLERLKEWLNNWKIKLTKDNLNNSKVKSNPFDSDSDYSYDSDCSSVDSSANKNKGRKFYPNAILLAGPHGCGKTSSIYSVAKHLGFKVFEVNSSSLRCKSHIIQELEGALNSHHVSNSSTTGDSATSRKESERNFKLDKFFKSSAATNFTSEEKSNATTSKNRRSGEILTEPKSKPKKKRSIDTNPKKKRKISLRRETVLSRHKSTNRKSTDNTLDHDDSSQDSTHSNDNDSSDENVKSSSSTSTLSLSSSSSSPKTEKNVNLHKESLILFDEIDVVFKEDVGFWSAISHFIKRSKKPIILTTNDDFILEKFNLNVEKIDFVRPRVDAAVRFLKSVAKKENRKIDTATASRIITECKCDMRRALVQLQALIGYGTNRASIELDNALMDKYRLSGLNSTQNLNKHLSKWLFSSCGHHNETNYFRSIFYLDVLCKQLLKYNHMENMSNINAETSVNFKRYDMFLLKDGLTDNSNSNSLNFNPFLNAQQIQMLNQDVKNQQQLQRVSNHDMNNYNTTLLKYQLGDFYTTFITLFNDHTLIDLNDWLKHGAVNKFNFISCGCINKLAQNMFKFTSNSSLTLDYRPYLQVICGIEELRQQANNRKRYLHYLTHTSIGLNRDDFALLAKSSLVEKLNQTSTGFENSQTSTCSANIFLNNDLFFDEKDDKS